MICLRKFFFNIFIRYPVKKKVFEYFTVKEKMMRLAAFLFAIISLFSSIQCHAGGTVQIVIEPVFKGAPVKVDQLYITPNGDSIYIDLLRFYISDISISGDKQQQTEKNSFHLVNLVDADGKRADTIVWNNVHAHTYNTLSFNLGIDSATNMSGAQGGDLDPTKAMYWAWNTGYINAKLEGRSNTCKTLHHVYEFHIGGFHTPYNTLRKISIPLDSITITNDTVRVIHLKADVATWFEGILLKKDNSIVDPGNAAMKMADNYAHMFSVEQQPGKP
ncbi:MbnP family protein [Chitinophagaceae bacterium MMS25-I14]